MPEVSVIILTKNGGSRFGSLLDQIYSQDLESDFEVIILDSGSTDATLSLSRKSQAVVREIDPEDFGHASARNLGARMANGSHLVYLSQDATPCRNDWLNKLVSPLRSGEADIVYGRQIAYDQAQPMDKFFYWHFYPENKITVKQAKASSPGTFYLEYVFVSDVNAAIRRKAWEDVTFNEQVSFAEDKDFAIRAVAKGYRVVYEPEAAVYHSHFYSIGSLVTRRFSDGHSFSRTSAMWKATSERRPSFVKEGLEYWTKELRFLLNQGYAKWIPYAFVYDLAFFGAFKIGQAVFGISRRSRQRVGR